MLNVCQTTNVITYFNSPSLDITKTILTGCQDVRKPKIVLYETLFWRR